MIRPCRGCSSLLCLAIFASTSAAQVTLDGVQFQRTIMGPAWNADKLTGKVVFIVLWSPKAPVSFKPLARAAQLDKDLGPFGLIVVGPSMEKMDDAIVEAKAKALGVKFSVTENIAAKGLDGKITVPKSITFGVDGKMLPEEPSDKAEKRVRTLLGAAIADRAKPNIMGTTVQAALGNLRKGTPPATVLSGLISRQSDPDAKALVESICFAAKEQFDDAKERIETDPVGVYHEVQKLSSVFRGTAVGKQASDLFTKLKNDKLVQQELAARPSLEKAQKLDELLEKAMKADPTKSDPSSPEFTKAHSPLISQIRTIATQMRASWPKTRAASEASDIAMKYGVKFK